MMQIQKGLVKYKDRSDIVCTYGTTDDGKTYYFLDGEKLSNGYIIASTALVEAIDPLAVASSIGVINSEGKEVIPFTNKSIKSITDKILLVEVAHPTAQSVLDAIDLRKDPLAATKLVSTSATIKEKIYSKMGTTGRFVFNDQFSEAMICDLDGHNLMGDEKYSFIGVNDTTIFLSKNIIDSPLEEYTLEEKKDIPTNEDDIAIQDALISKDVIDAVMDSDNNNDKNDKNDKNDDNNGVIENSVSSLDTKDNKQDNIVELKEKEEEPVVSPIVPNVIIKDDEFENASDDEVGDEKSKVDDKESSFSLFDNVANDSPLDIPVNDTVAFEDSSLTDHHADKYNDVVDLSDNMNYGFEDKDREKDTIFDEAVVVINRMIGQIEEQRKTISSYEEKLEKLVDYRQRVYDENKKLVRRYEMLLQEYKKLQSEIEHKDEMIESQRKEISKLKNQISSKKDLARLLEKAQNIFDEDYEDGYSKVKSL